MSTSAPDSALPDYQRDAAAKAHLHVDQQADQAQAGTPHYGSFGKPEDVTPTPSRDGSNDNPDEFSDGRDREDSIPREGKTNSGDPNPHHQTGHVQQNRDPQAVRDAQGVGPGSAQQEEDNSRTAWAQDDERYAGGHAEASWQENNDQEHDKND